jgi:hypothetical protein
VNDLLVSHAEQPSAPWAVLREPFSSINPNTDSAFHGDGSGPSVNKQQRTGMQPMTETEWDLGQVARRKLHERYIGGIALAIIIGLLAVRWGDVPKLTDYIGFALTLTSLILALVAIGYAIYTNTGLERNMSGLEKSVEQMSGLATNISSSSHMLGDEVRRLSMVTSSIDTRVQSTQGRVEEIAERLQKAPRERRRVARSASVDQGKIRSISGLDVVEFVENSSIAGAFLAYAWVSAFISKKPLNIIEVAKSINLDDEYACGFLIASKGAYVVKGDMTFDAVQFTEINGASITCFDRIERCLVEASIRLTDKDVDMVSYNHVNLKRLREYLAGAGFELAPQTEGLWPPVRETERKPDDEETKPNADAN